MLLVGFGAAAGADSTGMSGATAHDAGLAAGLFSTSQQIGTAVSSSVRTLVTLPHRIRRN
jgi:hypothetical protein